MGEGDTGRGGGTGGRREGDAGGRRRGDAGTGPGAGSACVGTGASSCGSSSGTSGLKSDTGVRDEALSDSETVGLSLVLDTGLSLDIHREVAWLTGARRVVLRTGRISCSATV